MAALTGAVMVASCAQPSAHNRGAPTAKLTASVTAHYNGSYCAVSAPPSLTSAQGDPLMVVHRDPSGAHLVWAPRMSARAGDCVVRERWLRADRAQHLVGLISATKPVPRGRYSCPADDGSWVLATFGYRNRPREYVVIRTSGCAWVSAPHRQSLWVSDALSGDLATLRAGADPVV